MIDINKSKIAFKEFVSNYEETPGYNLKIVHTYHVANNARELAKKLNLSQEDIDLAELIGILHDIGRFEELKVMNGFNSVKFNHAEHGVKMLFEENLIRKFIEDPSYDEIIRVAIINHSKLKIDDNLSEKELLHSKIIRDADKLDNFRVKEEENIEDIFAGTVNSMEEIENSLISPKVYEDAINRRCIDIHDRVYPLDYFICVLAFAYDLNFQETKDIVIEKNYIDRLIDRVTYKNETSRNQMEEIRKTLNNHLKEDYYENTKRR